VEKKPQFLQLAADPAPLGPTYMVQYSSAKVPAYKEGTVTEVTKLKESYNYYKLSFPIEKPQCNSPLLLPSGQVFALAQEDASGKKEVSFGVSASYAGSLRYTSVDIFNTMYTRINIRKAWPEDAEQASVALFLMASSQDAGTYLATIGDFINTFPNHEDGYMTRASHYASRYANLPLSREECLKLASEDMATALKLAVNKSAALFKQAQLVYTTFTNDTTIVDDKWGLPAASGLIAQATEMEDSPAYRTLEGEIAFYQGDYQRAYDAYMKAGKESSSYYMAAKSLENIPGSQIDNIIALLDSSIMKMGVKPPKEAAPIVLERVDYKMQLNMYKEAVEDYDLYYYLSDGKVNENFYFFREQAKFKNGDNAGALEDIREAIKISAQAEYYAEEAAILIRLQNYVDAVKSIEKALSLSPDFAACYRLLGICNVRTNKREEACRFFDKAKEMGDPLAVRLIKEYCK
jgi:tetratricopeptide (TPR) repeat protein